MLSENQLHLINKIPVKRRFEVSTNSEDLLLYLKKNKGKTCKDMKPIFMIEEYREYANTQIRKLTSDEIQKYMSERFEEGLAFLKSIERGKSFIEYIPAENAWNPISVQGYMYIDCLWGAGSFKGHGYSSDLLNACIADSKKKGKKGLCILAAANKKAFLADLNF